MNDMNEELVSTRPRVSIRAFLQLWVASLAGLSLISATAFAQVREPQPPAGVPSGADESHADKAKAAKRLSELQSKVSEIDTQLQRAQQKALTVEHVQEKQSNYVTIWQSTMVKIAPSVEPKLEKRAQLATELTQSDELRKPDNQRSPEFRERVQDYEKISAEIEPIAEKARQQPQVVVAYQDFNTAVAKEMEKVDPEVPQLFDQRQKLASEYQQIAQAGALTR